MHNVIPKKRLGQHFLKDHNIAQKIIKSIINTDLCVVEVGPGKGILTEYLIKEKRNFLAVDVDMEMIEYLKATYPQFSNNFISADILKEDLKKYIENKIVLLGNFPYNISSQLFFKILNYRNLIKEVVCMVQREVAERICEEPGSKTYGILSVLIQAFYTPKYLFSVSEKVFFPTPNVKSAVIRLVRNKVDKLECDEKLFFNVVKKAFNQRRKKISNSLKEFDLTGLDKKYLNDRPEQLCVEDFVNITRNIKSNL